MRVKEIGSSSYKDTKTCQDEIVRCLMDVALQDKMKGILDPKVLPRKYLPPGKRSDLYHLYLASCTQSKTRAASSKTFYRAFGEWRKILRFRPRTQHAQCSICHRLKAAMSNSRSFVDHARHCDEYHRHLAGMFADRKVYAALRARATLLLLLTF